MMIRRVTAVAVLVSAAVHLFLWFDGMRSASVVGPAFLLNAVGGVVIALLLLTWRSWFPAFLAVGFGLSTLTAFLIAVTVGLFGVHERWTSWTVWVAGLAEIVALVGGARILVREGPVRLGRQPQHDAAVQSPHLH